MKTQAFRVMATEDGVTKDIVTLSTTSAFIAQKNREAWRKRYPNSGIYVERLIFIDGELDSVEVLD